MRHTLRNHVGKATRHVIYLSYLSVYSGSKKGEHLCFNLLLLLFIFFVTFPTWWRNTWRISKMVQDGHLWLKSIYIYFFLFRKLPIVSLDKTLISRLGSCRDVEAALRRTSEPSENIGIVGCHWSPFCVEKSWNVFLKNLNFFSTEERKTWISWMTSGWVNYQQKLFLKVN